MVLRQARRVAVTALLACLPACGTDGTGPDFPDVRGTFTITWVASFGNPLTGGTTSLVCAGTLTVTEQSGATFSGTFMLQQGGDCQNAQSGTLSGEVRGDGGIDFFWLIPGADPFELTAQTGCTVSSSDGQYNGVFDGSELSATSSATLSCSGVSITVTLLISGMRAA